MSSQVTGRLRSRENLGYTRHPSVPSTTDDADDYPKDGTYENQLAWVQDRGYPEGGTHEAKREWVKANGQLPPYPRHGTPLEKIAWARLSTAYLTDTSDTKWHGEDLSEPLLEYTVNRRSGEPVSLRLVPRGSRLALSVRGSTRAPRRRNVRRPTSRARGPDDPLPKPLEAVPLSRFRRDVAAWLEAKP